MVRIVNNIAGNPICFFVIATHFLRADVVNRLLLFCQISRKIFFKIKNLFYMNFYRNLVTWSG